MSSHYRRGADFERAVCAYLAGKGALCIRSAGSHGIVDIIALWPAGRAWLVQAKSNGRMDPAERRALAAAAHRYSSVPIKASRPKRGVILCERYYPTSGIFGEIEL
ncbi:MAG: hypothetical protein ABFD52_08930 [Acidobacteriota bacterium]